MRPTSARGFGDETVRLEHQCDFGNERLKGTDRIGRRIQKVSHGPDVGSVWRVAPDRPILQTVFLFARSASVDVGAAARARAGCRSQAIAQAS